jgi:phage terminase large subunit
MISSYMKPAESVGGDYFDLINHPDGDWFLIGDVSGHGILSGLIMMMVQTSIQMVRSELKNHTPSSLILKLIEGVEDNFKKIAGKEFKYMTITIFKVLPTGEVLYGMDYGFMDPMVLVKVTKKSKSIWVEELIYESQWTIEDVIQRMNELGVPKSSTIFCDSAMPGYIETLRRAGYVNAQKANKGPGSKKIGIDRIKSYQVFVSPHSKNIINEYNTYSYRPGKDEPIDGNDHALDSLMYALSHDKGETPQYAYATKKQSLDFQNWGKQF